MSKSFVKSSFMSPVTGGGKRKNEFRFERVERVRKRIASIDKKIRRALNRGDLESVSNLAAQRNILLQQI